MRISDWSSDVCSSDLVIDFWFGAPDSPERTRFRDQWFKADAAFDDEIRRRFLLVWQALRDGGLEHWHDTPEHALAYVIVADQFPRNCFREIGRASCRERVCQYV